MFKRTTLIWLCHVPLVLGVVLSVANAGMLEAANMTIFYITLVVVFGALLVIIILVFKEWRSINGIYKIIGVVYSMIFVYLCAGLTVAVFG